MGSKCHFVVCEKEETPLEDGIILLRDRDGYPGKPDGTDYGMLSELTLILPCFMERRGFDCEALAAQLIAFLVSRFQKIMAMLCRDNLEDSEEEKARHAYEWAFLGHGICQSFDNNAQYLYRIDPSGVIVMETERSEHANPDDPQSDWMSPYLPYKNLIETACYSCEDFRKALHKRLESGTHAISDTAIGMAHAVVTGEHPYEISL